MGELLIGYGPSPFAVRQPGQGALSAASGEYAGPSHRRNI